LPNNAHVDHRHGSVVRHNRFSRAVSRDGGMSFEDLEKRYGNDAQASKSRPPPETPTWKLTRATDGSDTTLKVDDTEFPREKTSIQFVDENPMRERQTNKDMGFRPSTESSTRI
jgi:hypothetical protein